MDLSWVALGLSGVALLHAFLYAARARAAGPAGRIFIFAALALVLLAVLATLPAHGLWSTGQQLWPGLLAGGLAVFLAAEGSRWAAGAEQRSWYACATLRAAAPAFTMSGLLLFAPRTLFYAAPGYAAAALAAGIVIAGGLWLSGKGEEDQSVAASVEGAAITAVVLGAATFFAVLHRTPAGVRDWQPLPSLLLAVAAAGLAIRSAVTPTTGQAAPRETEWLRSLVSVVVPVIGIAWLTAYRLAGAAGFLNAVWLGVAVYALVAWLDRTGAPALARLRLDLGLLASLLIVGAAAVVFRELHGLGLALAVLAGTVSSALLPRRVDNHAEPDRLLRAGLSLGLVVVLYRVYEERIGSTHGVEPDFFYYYAALIVGAILPALLAGGLSARRRSLEDGRPAAPLPAAVSLSWLGLAGLVAALAPLLLWLLLGPRPQAAFLVGIPIGLAFLLSATPRDDLLRTLAGLLGGAATLSAALLTRPLQPLELWTRMARVGILGAVAVIVILWLLAASLAESRAVSRK